MVVAFVLSNNVIERESLDGTPVCLVFFHPYNSETRALEYLCLYIYPVFLHEFIRKSNPER